LASPKLEPNCHIMELSLRTARVTVALAVVLAGLGSSCGADPTGSLLTGDAGARGGDARVTGDDARPPNQAPGDPVIAAAGDIACDGCKHQETAALLTRLLGERGLAAILPLGDEAYPRGGLADFQSYYTTSWGAPALLAITHPVPGNHEYAESPGDGYFDYFNGAQASTGVAGDRSRGYYSFDVGSWHLVALNSNDACHDVACDVGSPQQQWLAADLAAHPTRCALAFWHHPRFQGGTEDGETEAVGPLWDTFHDAGGDVVLTAHEHNYQQLAPLNKAGTVDPANGIRSFVVGTGGAGLASRFGAPHEAAIETRVVDSRGVLELTLMDGRYEWRFVTTEGTVPPGASGSATCR
jgi:acid phosphatase type 7